VVEGDVKRSTWLACEGIMGNMTLFFAWVFPSVSALLRGSFILANHQIMLGRFCLPLVTETNTAVKTAPNVFQ
jgi:hypothetical protein